MKGVFIAPAILMLGVAVQSRPNYIDFDRMIVDQETDRRITAYIPIVRTTEGLLSDKHATDAQVRRTAEEWIKQAKSGKLQALRAEATDDSIHLGIKGQILSAAKGLSSLLVHQADREIETGQYGLAATDLLKAANLVEPLRYSDLTSVAVVGNHQRRLLKRLNQIWDRVPAQEKSALKATLHDIKPQPDQFTAVVHQERRLAVVEDVRSREVALAAGKKPNTITLESDLGLIVTLGRDTDKENQRLIDELKRS
jgi:hypothetical protein